jgi:D-methionine transport system substrate-binding protein
MEETNMKLKKLITLTLSAATLALFLTACGSKPSETTATTDSKPEETKEAGATDETGSQAATETKVATVTVKLGVVGSIYEELWTPAKEALKNEGINLDIVQFSDYVTPNNALANGEIDLNAFQHRIYLKNEVESYSYKIEPIGNTFIIPLNLYSSKVKSVSEIKDGDTIAIPNDVTNGGRALKVLESAGLIKIKKDAGFNPTIDDIETYTVKIKIQELAANTIPSALADVAAGIVNGNFALDFGLKTDEAIFKDTSLEEENYWNLIAARSEDLSDPEKKAVYEKVVKAFQSSETEKVFDDNFGGFFIKAGWDQNLLSK